jgi:hypothetical protein
MSIDHVRKICKECKRQPSTISKSLVILVDPWKSIASDFVGPWRSIAPDFVADLSTFPRVPMLDSIASRRRWIESTADGSIPPERELLPLLMDRFHRNENYCL